MTQLALIRQGGLLEDIDEALRELNRCVGFIGKGGTLTIKISVKPATKNSGSSVIVSDEVNLKTPKLPTAETILLRPMTAICVNPILASASSISTRSSRLMSRPPKNVSRK